MRGEWSAGRLAEVLASSECIVCWHGIGRLVKNGAELVGRFEPTPAAQPSDFVVETKLRRINAGLATERAAKEIAAGEAERASTFVAA
jgi:hypothetical protein